MKAATEAGNKPLIAGALSSLGQLAFDQGEYHEAQKQHQAALALWRKIDHPGKIATVLCRLGYTMATLKRQEAQAYFQEALQLATQQQIMPVILDVVLGLTIILVEADQH